MEEMSTEFVEYLRKRTQDYLRVVAQYEGKETEVLYTKDALSQKTVNLKVRNMLKRLRQMKAIDSEEELGERYGCVQVREEAVLIHVPKRESGGFMIDFEPEAARKLVGFLDDCHEFFSRDFSSI